MIPETWVVYQIGWVDDFYPIACGNTFDNAWDAAYEAYYKNDEMTSRRYQSDWRKDCDSAGWKCLRVVPAEGQT